MLPLSKPASHNRITSKLEAIFYASVRKNKRSSRERSFYFCFGCRLRLEMIAARGGRLHSLHGCVHSRCCSQVVWEKGMFTGRMPTRTSWMCSQVVAFICDGGKGFVHRRTPAFTPRMCSQVVVFIGGGVHRWWGKRVVSLYVKTFLRAMQYF